MGMNKMAVVEFKGLGRASQNKPGTFPYMLRQLIKKGGNFKDVFEDIGRTGVTLTTEKLLGNKVRPKTSQGTLDARRQGRRRFKGARVGNGLTLVDTGVGLRQVSYRATSSSVEVGVPDGYMAYHQEGRVPNARRRMFLMLPNRKYILDLVGIHIKKAMR